MPGQYSSGGKARLGRITKAGDRYLRSLLVMGARAILSGLGEKQDRFSRWARSLAERRGYWKAVVAIAAKERVVAIPAIQQVVPPPPVQKVVARLAPPRDISGARGSR